MVDEYYVYAYYLISTDEIFYIGKGKGLRYKDIKHSRNSFFINMINKHKEDVDVKLLYQNLTNDQACVLERDLIKKYKHLGQCRANLHEGGLGGNTGNYNKVSKALSCYYTTHKRSETWFNSMKEAGQNKRGYKHSSDAKAKMSLSAKKSWEDKTTEANIRRLKHLSTICHKKGDPGWNLGKKMGKETYQKMMNADCPYKYEVYFDNTLIYWSISSQKMEDYCKETFNISRTIIYQIIKGTWVPKFTKHKYLTPLKILKLDRSVSTNRDECSDVEWRLQPFEVPGNLTI